MKKIKIPIGARAAIVYTIANIFSRGLAIITMPIFTRIMSVEQIGVINLYNIYNATYSDRCIYDICCKYVFKYIVICKKI